MHLQAFDLQCEVHVRCAVMLSRTFWVDKEGHLCLTCFLTHPPTRQDRTCDDVRAGCLKLLASLCAAGGSPLWREGAHGAEEALRMCLVLTEDCAQVGQWVKKRRERCTCAVIPSRKNGVWCETQFARGLLRSSFPE